MNQPTMKALQLTRATVNAPPTVAKALLPTPSLKPGGFPYTTFPRVPGRDYSGVVVDVADANAKTWIGKSVYGTSGSTLGFSVDGTHAQYCLIPQAVLVEKPTSLSHLQAATVGVPFTTAFMCLSRAQVNSDDTVLVLGSNGAVGSAAVQMAKAMGAKRVFTAARRDHSNPDIVLATKDIAAVLKNRIASLTNGKGVDVVVDTVGDVALMSAAMAQLAINGRFAWIAAPRGDVDKSISLDVFQTYRKGLSLVGCNSILPSVEELAEQLRSINDWIDQGLLKAQDEKEYEMVTLDDAVENGYGKTGKVVIGMS